MNKKSRLALVAVILVVLLVVVAFILVRTVFSPQPGVTAQSMPQSAPQSISPAQSQSSQTVTQTPPTTAPKSLPSGRGTVTRQSAVAKSAAPTHGNSNSQSSGTSQEPTRFSVYRQGWCPGDPPPYDLKNPPADLTPPDGQSPDHPQGEWVTVFEKHMKKNYGIVDHYLYTGGGRWWVWVKGYDTGCNPFVTIDQYTGWQHG